MQIHLVAIDRNQSNTGEANGGRRQAEEGDRRRRAATDGGKEQIYKRKDETYNLMTHYPSQLTYGQDLDQARMEGVGS